MYSIIQGSKTFKRNTHFTHQFRGQTFWQTPSVLHIFTNYIQVPTTWTPSLFSQSNKHQKIWKSCNKHLNTQTLVSSTLTLNKQNHHESGTFFLLFFPLGLFFFVWYCDGQKKPPGNLHIIPPKREVRNIIGSKLDWVGDMLVPTFGPQNHEK